jgi:hypothetical protein
MRSTVTALLGATMILGLASAPSLAASSHDQSPKAAAAKAGAKAAAKKGPAQRLSAAETRAMSAAAGTTRLAMAMAAGVNGWTKTHATRAAANATIYTNKDGALTGLTLQSWGLPDPERMDARTSRYVVWLTDAHGDHARRLGQLESHNGSRAVFGFTPEHPVTGMGRLMVTSEAMEGVSRPTGMVHMSAELPAGKR